MDHGAHSQFQKMPDIRKNFKKTSSKVSLANVPDHHIQPESKTYARDFDLESSKTFAAYMIV